MRTKTINLRRGAFGQPSVPFLLSRRAHLLTTPKGRWYCQRLHRMQPCALRGGCGFCSNSLLLEALMDNATALRHCCHCPRSRCAAIASPNTVASTDSIPPTARINLPPAALFAVMTVSLADGHFLFAKKKQKQERKDGEDEWRSTTWKPKWSAEVRDGLRLPLPLI